MMNDKKMSTLPNEIVLRPRFQKELKYPKEKALNAFETATTTSFIIKRIDDHVFIKFNKEQINFWSPQLHLEINDTNENHSRLYGLFGPNPTLWTFFMFLHFGVATIFVIFGIWAYSNWSIQEPFALQMAIMICMVVVWFALYAFGRFGKTQGKDQMKALHLFMEATLAAL